MTQRQLLAAAAVWTSLLIGCSHEHGMNRPANESAQHQADELESLIKNIQKARNSAAEADAIHKLHDYVSSHGMTYTIKTIRLADSTPMESASVGTQPVIADVTLYHANDVVRAFAFTPQNNANLALFGS